MIDYQCTEIEVLCEPLCTPQLLLRRRLAVKAETLGWKRLRDGAQIVTPDTIMRWHRQVVATKWYMSNQVSGRTSIRRSSATVSPAYFFFQRSNARSLTPSLRMIAATAELFDGGRWTRYGRRDRDATEQGEQRELEEQEVVSVVRPTDFPT